jgi:2-methylcitrate dehydratase PrpD
MSAKREVMLSARIAEHVARAKFEALPAKTVLAAKRAILDGLGVMLAASGMSRDVLPFVDLARAQGGPAEASILGFGDRVGLPMAAFANGSMAHALDYEDAFDAVPVHPNASLLPAAFASAEARAPVSGRDFIAAVATGCDLVCRMALALRQPMEIGGWYPPPILGGYGAVAAVARLRELTAAEATDAFSLLLCQNTCPGEIKYSPATVIRAVREAFPCQAAVLSVLLAERGIKGFEYPFEGRGGFYQLYAAGQYDASALLDGLGNSYWIEQLSFKPWPCCRGTHASIEAVQVLKGEHGFSADEVVDIHIVGGDVQRMLFEPEAQKRHPQTVIDAKFSLPFTVAAALAHDHLALGSFTPDTLRDPLLLSLACRVRFDTYADGQARGADAGEVTITLTGDRALHHAIPHALGGPTRPLADAVVHAKFLDCAARAAVPLPPAQAERLAERLWNLESEPDVGALLTATPPPNHIGRRAAPQDLGQ